MRANSATIFKPASLQENSANSLFRNILRITSLDARICQPSNQPARVTTNKINSLPGVIKKYESSSRPLLALLESQGSSARLLTVDPKAPLLLALDPCALELVAFLPADQFGQAGRFPSQCEAEPGHRRVAYKIHIRVVLVAGLVIVLLDVFALLLHAPGFRMSLELRAFIDGERRNADPSHAEMIGAVEVPGLRA